MTRRPWTKLGRVVVCALVLAIVMIPTLAKAVSTEINDEVVDETILVDEFAEEASPDAATTTDEEPAFPTDDEVKASVGEVIIPIDGEISKDAKKASDIFEEWWWVLPMIALASILGFMNLRGRPQNEEVPVEEVAVHEEVVAEGVVAGGVAAEKAVAEGVAAEEVVEDVEQ